MSDHSFIAPRRRAAGLRVVVALMLREMATTYGRSPGGYVWALLEPVAGIAILTLVFSYIMREPPLGNNFPLFYATGFLPFMLYTSMTNKIAASIRFSKPLLEYPAVTYIDAIIGRTILALLTNIVVMSIVFAGIVIFYGLNLLIDYTAILLALAMLVILSLGIGTINCYLFSLFGAWEQIWSILNRPMFVLSGIFMLLDGMPEPFRSYLFLNPLAHVISQFRAGFYSTYDARYVSVPYVFGFGLVALVIGLLLLYRNHRTILNEGA